MTTAVDTSVLLDILLDDPRFGTSSERALQSARRQGRLIVCETVVAELRPALDSEESVLEFLGDLGLEFVPSDLPCALRAGSTYLSCLTHKGEAKRVLPDFLVASHAQTFGDALLARDRGYYRQHFTGLTVVEPRPSP